MNDDFNVEDLLRKIEREPYLRALTVEQLFFILLNEKLVSYNDLSKAYVSHLENNDNENRCKIVEATTRLFQQFVSRMKKTAGRYQQFALCFE